MSAMNKTPIIPAIEEVMAFLFHKRRRRKRTCKKKKKKQKGKRENPTLVTLWHLHTSVPIFGSQVVQSRSGSTMCLIFR